MVVDTLGLLWGVWVTDASASDRDGALRLLVTLRGLVSRLKRIWADGGYRGSFIDIIRRVCGWTVEIVLRSDDAQGFVVLPMRWIVERTFAWLLNARRLSKDYEYSITSSTGMIYSAMIRIMLRRLAA